MNLDFTVKKDKVKEDEGIVYLLDMDVDGKQIVKIGVTTRLKIEERVCEILKSHFYKYRFFCRLRPKRFRKTTDIFGKEKMLLDYFSNYKFIPEKKIQGHTEMIEVPLDEVVSVYERVLDGEILEGRYELESTEE